MEIVSSALTGLVRTAGPLKARGFAEFSRCVASMCNAPFRQAGSLPASVPLTGGPPH
jgi:hypothetical protein